MNRADGETTCGETVIKRVGRREGMRVGASIAERAENTQAILALLLPPLT